MAIRLRSLISGRSSYISVESSHVTVQVLLDSPGLRLRCNNLTCLTHALLPTRAIGELAASIAVSLQIFAAMAPRHIDNDEERPLLHPDRDFDVASTRSTETQQLQFSPDDEENPKAWGPRKKLINVGIISLMAILTPLASSMFTPGISQIAEDLGTDEQKVIATTTGFVITSGLGPLLWAPLSEDFGRRTLYISCFAVFTALQVASALSPNIDALIAIRTLSGFFGSLSTR